MSASSNVNRRLRDPVRPACGGRRQDVHVVVARARWRRPTAASSGRAPRPGSRRRTRWACPSATTPRSAARARGGSDFTFGQSVRWTRHALAPRDEPDDLVAGDRRAAPRQPDPHVARPLHDDALDVVRPRARGRAARAGPRSRPRRWCPRPSRASRATTDCGDTCPSPIATYSASRSGYFRSAATCCSASSVARRLNGRRLLAQQPLEQVAPLLQRVLAALPREPLPDLVPGPRRLRRSAASPATAPRPAPSR